MSDLEEKKETPVEEVTFESFIGSKEYIDHINSEKSKWANDFREKESEALRGKIREELMKELNPEETPLEKEVRELKEARAKDLAEKARLEREKYLTKLAKEKKYDFGLDKVERYASFGEEAEGYMLEDFEWMQSKINSEIEKHIKGSFGKDEPTQSDKSSEDEYDMSSAMKSALLKIRK